MRCTRAQLTVFGPVVAALFALATSVPRAAFVYHQHAGAERAHTHADGDPTLTALLEDAWDGHEHRAHHRHGDRRHGHAAAHTSATSSAPALQSDDGSASGHWHQQQRFQRAVPVVAPQVDTVAPAGAAPAAAPARGWHASAPIRQARAPPHRTVS